MPESEISSHITLPKRNKWFIPVIGEYSASLLTSGGHKVFVAATRISTALGLYTLPWPCEAQLARDNKIARG